MIKVRVHDHDDFSLGGLDAIPDRGGKTSGATAWYNSSGGQSQGLNEIFRSIGTIVVYYEDFMGLISKCGFNLCYKLW